MYSWVAILGRLQKTNPNTDIKNLKQKNAKQTPIESKNKKMKN